MEAAEAAGNGTRSWAGSTLANNGKMTPFCTTRRGMRLASSRVKKCAAERRPGSSSK